MLKPSEIAKRDLAEWESYTEAEREEMRRYIPEADDFPSLCRAYLRLREAAEHIKNGREDILAAVRRGSCREDYVTIGQALDRLVAALEERDDS